VAADADVRLPGVDVDQVGRLRAAGRQVRQDGLALGVSKFRPVRVATRGASGVRVGGGAAGAPSGSVGAGPRERLVGVVGVRLVKYDRVVDDVKGQVPVGIFGFKHVGEEMILLLSVYGVVPVLAVVPTHAGV